MPTYDYRCDTNDRVVEVKHGMSEQLSTWGELCERAGIEPGDTPAHAPVQRLITGGYLNANGSGGADLPPCASGGCGTGMCGL